MAEGRISKRSVDAFSCPLGSERAFLWDDTLTGFGLSASPSGRKVYVAQFRVGGRSRRIAIGEHGPLTPDEARKQAKLLLGDVARGLDPVEARRAERRVRTFREIADDYMKLHIRAKRKPRTAEEYQRLLDRSILPAIGSRRLVDLRRADVARLHNALAEAPVVANKCVEIISSVWNFAARHDEVAEGNNPAKQIVKNRGQKRERFLTRDEFRRLGEVLRLVETDGLPWQVEPTSKHAPKPDKRRVKLDPCAVGAIRLLMLTGARLREILHARWEQVDFERGILFLPDSKTGAKPIYLNAPALAVLEGLPRLANSPFLFPGLKPDAPRSDLKKPWAAVTRAANLKIRLHDLRHSFASVGAGASLGLPIVGKLLGHTQAQTTARYAHLDADPLHRAANMIGDLISTAMEGGDDDK